MIVVDQRTFVQGRPAGFGTCGEGMPVVLLHGFASSLETWSGLAPKLAREHRVIALDLKGFGWTDRPEGDYSPAAQAQLVRDLLRQRGVERASVVAHSWGSSVALALALAEPQLVQRVVLYDAWVYDEQLPPFFRWAMLPGVGEALFGLYYNQQPEARLALGFYRPERVPQQLVLRRRLWRPAGLEWHPTGSSPGPLRVWRRALPRVPERHERPVLF